MVFYYYYYENKIYTLVCLAPQSIAVINKMMCLPASFCCSSTVSFLALILIHCLLTEHYKKNMLIKKYELKSLCESVLLQLPVLLGGPAL